MGPYREREKSREFECMESQKNQGLILVRKYDSNTNEIDKIAVFKKLAALFGCY